MARWGLVGAAAAACWAAATAALAEPVEIPRLGIAVEDVTAETMLAQGLFAPSGLLIVSAEGSDEVVVDPGFAAGDHLLAVDAAQPSAAAFAEAVAAAEVGAAYQINALRDGAPIEITATLVDPPERVPAFLGVNFREATPEEGGPGILVLRTLLQGSAARSGVEVGDVIVAVDGAPTLNQEAFLAAIQPRAAGETVALSIRRGASELTIAAELIARPDRILAAPPLLMVDGGGHSALIRDVIFHPDGERLISAGDDKTIRVWNWRTGELLQVIRGPSGFGGAGRIFALALSPDGRTLAVGGWLDDALEERHAVRLMDLETGAVTGLLRGHESVISDLAYSLDGRFLVSGSADRTARVWDLETGESVVLRGHTAEIYAVGVTPDGARVVTGSLDGDLRLWDLAAGAPIAVLEGHGDEVRSLAVAPDGTIASGDLSGEIRLWDGESGAARGVLAQTGGVVGALAFSPDGARLLAARAGVRGPWPARIFDVATGAELARQEGHDNILLAADWATAGDGAAGLGDIVATGGGNQRQILIWDAASGAVLSRLEGQGRQVWATGVGENGRRIGWGVSWRSSSWLAENPIEFALALPQSGDELLGAPVAVTGEDDFARAVLEEGGIRLRHAPGGPFGYQNGALLIERVDGGAVEELARIERDATNGQSHSAYTLTPDGRAISGGASGHLWAYDQDGRELGRFIGHTGQVWGVTVSPDGRLLVSGSSDQTVRIWNAETYELILTIFPTADGSYVAWTPQGYYTTHRGPDADIAPESRIGWLLNYGAEETPGWVTAEQLGPTLYRPLLITRALLLGSAEQAIEEAIAAQAARLAAGERVPFRLPESVDELLAAPPPRLRLIRLGDASLLAPIEDGEAVVGAVIDLNGADPETLELQALVRSLASGEARPLTLVADQNAYDIPEEVLAREGVARERVRLFRVPLFQGNNDIAFRATTEQGDSQPEAAVIQQPELGALDPPGRLRILAIGIDDYSDADGFPSLRYAAADARTFAATAAETLGGRHSSVETRIIAHGGDAEPTAENIREGLEWLRRDSARTDTNMLFVAGHGHSDASGYLILPQGATQGPDGEIRGALQWGEFLEPLRFTNGARLLFLDACRSDGAYHAGLSADAGFIDTHIFSSTSEGERAYESDGHGFFTRALLDGLEGAGFDQFDNLTTLSLGAYVAAAVADRSDDLQIPLYQPVPGTRRLILAER